MLDMKPKKNQGLVKNPGSVIRDFLDSKSNFCLKIVRKIIIFKKKGKKWGAKFYCSFYFDRNQL